jgi:hypothetical protein
MLSKSLLILILLASCEAYAQSLFINEEEASVGTYLSVSGANGKGQNQTNGIGFTCILSYQGNIDIGVRYLCLKGGNLTGNDIGINIEYYSMRNGTSQAYFAANCALEKESRRFTPAYDRSYDYDLFGLEIGGRIIIVPFYQYRNIVIYFGAHYISMAGDKEFGQAHTASLSFGSEILKKISESVKFVISPNVSLMENSITVGVNAGTMFMFSH